MTKKILAALGTMLMSLVVVLGLVSPAQAVVVVQPTPVTQFAPASTITGTNTITNSALSKRTLFVCSGQLPENYCATMAPNTYVYAGAVPGFNPNHVWVPQYQCMIWRVSKANYESPWYQECGGASGKWWDAGAVHRLMGPPVNIDVITNDPR